MNIAGVSLLHAINRVAAAAALAILLSLPGAGAHAQSIVVTHCQGACPQYGSPVAANQSNIVIHHLYAAGINGLLSLPDWVAYRLSKDAIGVASLLPRTWQPDRLLRFSPLEDIVQAGGGELKLSDTIVRNNNPYGGEGAPPVASASRARLAPMNSFANTPYWSELNNFSNMVTMPGSMRLGPWLQLEQRLNRLAADEGEVFVITGPVYLIINPGLPASASEPEPSAYYKLVSDASGFAAFLFPREMAQSESYCAGTTNLAELQSVTGLNFFPGRIGLAESPTLLEKLGCHE